jgi:hypothetical protein
MSEKSAFLIKASENNPLCKTQVVLKYREKKHFGA